MCGTWHPRSRSILNMRSFKKSPNVKCCQKCFTQKSDLTYWQDTVLFTRAPCTKEKPYQCEYCQKCFAQKSDLTIARYVRIHTKEKPYRSVWILLEMFHIEEWPDKTPFDSHQRETMSVWILSQMFTKKAHKVTSNSHSQRRVSLETN